MVTSSSLGSLICMLLRLVSQWLLSDGFNWWESLEVSETAQVPPFGSRANQYCVQIRAAFRHSDQRLQASASLTRGSPQSTIRFGWMGLG
jgi:hypothetical protein